MTIGQKLYTLSNQIIIEQKSDQMAQDRSDPKLVQHITLVAHRNIGCRMNISLQYSPSFVKLFSLKIKSGSPCKIVQGTKNIFSESKLRLLQSDINFDTEW